MAAPTPELPRFTLDGPGLRVLVTSRCVEQTGSPSCHPGRDMRKSHADRGVTQHDFNIVATGIKPLPYSPGVPDQEFGRGLS